MSIYSSFFTPETISILLCLHEATKQSEEVDPNNIIIQFLIKKILRLTEQASIQTSNQQFQAEMFSLINDLNFLEQYRSTLALINNFNSFYREVSNILKILKSIRSTKLEQGNVIDFLVRRLYIYFQKLDFKEILNIYNKFNDYLNGTPYKMRHHQFILTKSIQEVKFNLQNYRIKQNPEQINKILQELSQADHTFKTSYIKGLYKAQQNKPIESMHEIHRYFDRCLGNLFQEKTETSPMSNKINHCIISAAYSSLKMGHLEQCLQSISEGQRISQNNSDEESINNCIIYLYKIAEQLGKYQEEILLAEHAITHSLNLSNILLMVYSCLCYSAFQKKYNCENTEVTLLKSRHISWTEALHFSKKKIYSNFENNCKNIYHSFRNLLIPTFLHKLSILIHIPALKNLLINPYYRRQELLDLEVFQEFEESNSLAHKEIKKANRYFNMNQQILLNKAVNRLAVLQKQAKSPETIVKIKSFFCYLKLESEVQMSCYRSVEELVCVCRKYGFVKSYLNRALNYISKILLKNQLYYDALVKIEETIKFCEQNSFNEKPIVSLLLKSQALAEIGKIMESLEILRQLEEEGTIDQMPSECMVQFWSTKLLVTKKVIQTLQSEFSISFLNEISQLKKTQLDCLQNLFKSYLKEGCLLKIRANIEEQHDFIILNPLIVSNKQLRKEKLKHLLNYIQKVLDVYKNIDDNELGEQKYDEESVQLKVIKKIESLFFI